MNGTKSWVYELQGKTFVRLSSFETTYLRNSYFPYFADFNGDGKTDILYQNVQPEIMMMFIFCFLPVRIL